MSSRDSACYPAPTRRRAEALRTVASAAAALLTAALIPACGGDIDWAGPAVERFTSGDTVIVRTLAGSEWGEARILDLELSIGENTGDERYLLGSVAALSALPDGSVLVLDRQPPVIRHYRADGHHIRDIGRAGQGPGEFQFPHDLAILPDGRIAVLDRGNTRAVFFDPDGAPAGARPLPTPIFSSSTAMRAGADGSMWVSTSPLDAPTEVDGVQRIAEEPRGPADTLLAPLEGRPIERFEVPGFRTVIPMSPREYFSFLPPDRFAVGWSGEYRILIHAGGSLLRVEREVVRVPMSASERETRARSAIGPMPAFGGEAGSRLPEVPAVKPAFSGFALLEDGRLVVTRALASTAEPNPNHDPENPSSSPERWAALSVVDLFAPDGTFIGEIRFPASARTSLPSPAFVGDTIVWAIHTDALGVQRVGRFRIAPDSDG